MKKNTDEHTTKAPRSNAAQQTIKDNKQAPQEKNQKVGGDLKSESKVVFEKKVFHLDGPGGKYSGL